jgi:hypothetical protein
VYNNNIIYNIYKNKNKLYYYYYYYESHLISYSAVDSWWSTDQSRWTPKGREDEINFSGQNNVPELSGVLVFQAVSTTESIRKI